MGVFFTSDLHIGHKLVAQHRWAKFSAYTGHDYPSAESLVEWHDEKLAMRWDAVIKPNDIVWVLGDISVGGRAREAAALDRAAARPGEKHLIAGNHDSCPPSHRESHKDQRKYLEVFASVQSQARRRFNMGDGSHIDAVLSHFPYYGDREGAAPREMQWRLRDEGAYLLHGHTHSSKQFAGREIHVGLDAWNLTPVPLETIVDYLQVREKEAVPV